MSAPVLAAAHRLAAAGFTREQIATTLSIPPFDLIGVCK